MNASKIKIKKVKLNKHRQLDIEYTEIFEDGITADVKKNSNFIVHADLERAFEALKSHLAFLCDLKEADQITDINETENLTNLKVGGYSIGGTDIHEGVSLTGSKQIGNKLLNLNTPFTKWEDEFDPYEYENELAAAIHHCNYEVEEYLNGKFGITQMEFSFDEEHDEELD